MQTKNVAFNTEKAERKVKQIVFDGEVNRLKVIDNKEEEKKQKVIQEEDLRVKKELLNENSRVVKKWPKEMIESYSLEQLTQLVAETEEKEDEVKYKVIFTLIFILVAIIAYTSKLYLLLFITLINLAVFWVFVTPNKSKKPI